MLKTEEKKPDALWRKPITLEDFDEEDPLADLYRGREVGEPAPAIEPVQSSIVKKQVKATIAKKSSKPDESAKTVSIEPAQATSTKLSEPQLKEILKIKSETFQFTDIREILRGRSFDIYAYLRILSGESGVCKIKHNDLMGILNVSRPTLFKQGDWLTKLSLIEKASVPGDHLGTSYTVYRLEVALPLSEDLMVQMEDHIEALQQTLV